jgi:hypothetical protein
MKRLFVGLLTAAVVSGGMAACSTEPEPPPSQPVLSLVGTWDCLEFTDGGAPLGCSGTWVFSANGSVSIQITIGGSLPFSETGTYTQTGTTVVIDAGGNVTTLIIATAGAADVITLTDAAPPPATPAFFTLRRQ